MGSLEVYSIKLEPPCMVNPIEVVYDAKGEKILGWRTLGWKKYEQPTEA